MKITDENVPNLEFIQKKLSIYSLNLEISSSSAIKMLKKSIAKPLEEVTIYASIKAEKSHSFKLNCFHDSFLQAYKLIKRV